MNAQTIVLVELLSRAYPDTGGPLSAVGQAVEHMAIFSRARRLANRVDMHTRLRPGILYAQET